MVIVLSLGLFGIIVGVAYWFAREEEKTIKKIPPEEMDEKERQARREAAADPSSLCHDGSVMSAQDRQLQRSTIRPQCHPSADLRLEAANLGVSLLVRASAVSRHRLRWPACSIY